MEHIFRSGRGSFSHSLAGSAHPVSKVLCWRDPTWKILPISTNSRHDTQWYHTWQLLYSPIPTWTFLDSYTRMRI